MKIAHLGNFVAEPVPPLVQSLRLVAGPKLHALTRSQVYSRLDGVSLVFGHRRRSVDRERKSVVSGLLRRKRQGKRYVFIFGAGVMKSVVGLKLDFVRGVPQQSFETMFQIQSNIGAG